MVGVFPFRPPSYTINAPILLDFLMKHAFATVCLLAGLLLVGCDAKPAAKSGDSGSGDAEVSTLQGSIKVEGSSTVQPISNKGAELFNEKYPKVNIAVGGEGTGNGFKAMAKGECDFSGASRPIKKKELDKINATDIKFVEIPVAYDGLTIVVNNENDFIKELNIDQLKKIFRDDFAAKTWKEVDESWPDEPISLYIPGTASGTHDYFKEVVVGKEEDKSIRMDSQVQPSEDDKTLVTGVKGEKYAIGFFGYSYYVANKDELRAVPVVNPKTSTAVTPSMDTIKSGEYAPFSRPLFIYVNTKSYEKLEVEEYLAFFFDNLKTIVEKAGYVSLPSSIVDAARENLETGKTGSHFIDAEGKKRSGALESIFVPANLAAQE